MPKPSIYSQLAAIQVRGKDMKPSPRHWNPGMIRYKGRLWVCYRYHLGREHGSRSATALVPVDKTTLQPTAPSQHLNLPGAVGDEHFEDARLFIYKGAPHVSYTQMTGYVPGVDYKCIIKYARLKLQGNRWIIDEVFYPRYGRNGGNSKEKNWSFFEHNGGLYIVYQDSPTRKVIRIEGETVLEEFESPGVTWPWGGIRGGAPPVPYGPTMGRDGTVNHFLTVFHSSLPTEQAPHFVRYFGAAYLFEAKAPFKVVSVSAMPVMAGSEADGHGEDPRYSNGWKPFVVFPCGCVPDGDDWLVSMGVNDWQCAVGRMTKADLKLISPDRSDAPMRYFLTMNGSLPVKIIGTDGHLAFLNWEIPRADRRGAMAPPGLYATNDGREAEVISEAQKTEEITAEQYIAQGGRLAMSEKMQIPQFA